MSQQDGENEVNILIAIMEQLNVPKLGTLYSMLKA
jgi:hypothetical protein